MIGEKLFDPTDEAGEITNRVSREMDIFNLIQKIKPLLNSGVEIASINKIAYTSDASYTKPANLIGLIALILGGGGGGGACYGTDYGGGGGGGGGVKISYFSTADITDSIIIDIGAGGVGVVNSVGALGASTILLGGVSLAVSGGGGGGYGNSGAYGGTGGSGDIAGGVGGYGNGGSGYGDEGDLGFYGMGTGGTGGAESGGGGGEGCGGSSTGHTGDGNYFTKKDCKANTGCGGGGSGASYNSNNNMKRGGNGGSGVVYFVELLS